LSPRIYGLDRTSEGRRLTPAGKALKLKVVAVAIVAVVIGGLALENALLGGDYASGGTVDLYRPTPVVLEVRKETTGTYVLTMAPKPGKGGKRRSHVLHYSVAGPGRKTLAEGKDTTLTSATRFVGFKAPTPGRCRLSVSTDRRWTNPNGDLLEVSLTRNDRRVLMPLLQRMMGWAGK
jgi:hypothetical protein